MPNPPAPPLPPGPYEVTSNGLHGLRIGLWDEALSRFDPLPPNTEHFSSLAVAVNIGLEMAETPQARAALAELGRLVVHYRANTSDAQQRLPFAGNVSDMEAHVAHFLACVRASYPDVVIGSRSLDNQDRLAKTNKKDWWRGSFQTFDPKQAGAIYYNASRVHDMVAAHRASCQARPRSSQAQQHMQRWRNFLFMFACATLHELAHLFVCYLTGGAVPDTPDGITHLDYGSYFSVHHNMPVQGRESGRWLENFLYGGSIEYYADRQEGPDQAGIPYLLDSQAVAYQIQPQTIDRFVMDPRNYVFPFPVLPTPISEAERARRGLRSIAKVYGPPASEDQPLPPNVRMMEAAREDPVYSVAIEELRGRPGNPDLCLRVVKLKA